MKIAPCIFALCALLLGEPACSQNTGSDNDFNAATDAVRDHEFAKAIDLFLPLAESDMADAQFNLAVLYKLGRGYPQNFPEAFYWSALSFLGEGSYAKDMVDELKDAMPPNQRDSVIARIKTRLNAQIELGDVAATRKLARLFMELMEEPDYPSAYSWFSICYALGDNDCKQGRDDAGDELDAEALNKAQAETAKIFTASAFARTERAEPTATNIQPSPAEN